VGAIFNFILNMLPYMLFAIPFYTVFRVMLIKRRRQKIKLYREIALLFFVMFIVGLASQTVIPKMQFDDGGISIVEDRTHKTNLIPLKVIFETYQEVFIQDNIQYFLINFLGNIVMFVPIGFFLPLLWKFSNKKVIFLGFSASLMIEFTQLFLARGTDVDDLLLNTLGTLVGFFLYKLVNKKARCFVNQIQN